MKRVAIMQARMTSTRLPGKILMPLGGQPMLAFELARIQRAQRVDEVVVATTNNRTDDPVVALCDSLGVRWFRGSEHDVLARYVGAAREAKAELVLRITADCPFLDPQVVDAVVALAQREMCDYASNTLTRTFPRGLDCEALYMDVLERTYRCATSAPAREHVTYHIYGEAKSLHRIVQHADDENHSALRWTVDTPEDFKMVETLHALAGDAPYRTLLRCVQEHPHVQAINADVQQRIP